MVSDNIYPNPRGTLVKALLVDLKIARANFRLEHFEDRAISGLKDGYTSAQLCHLAESLLGRQGILAAKPEEKLLRTRMDLLFLHSMMLRGESTRYARLIDFCSLRLENEGQDCLAIVMQIRQGKTIDRADGSTNRKTKYSGMLRHKNVLTCPVGALAQWLFYRSEVAREARPDFRDRSSWYMTRLIPGNLRKPTDEISDGVQREWTRLAFEEAKIQTSGVVHAPRKSVARLMDTMEVPEDQVSLFG